MTALRKPRIPHSRADLLNKIELLRIAEDDEGETDEENDDSEYDYNYSDDLESDEGEDDNLPVK